MGLSIIYVKPLELLSRVCIRLGVQIPNVRTKSMELLFAAQMALELQSAGRRGPCIIQWSAFSEYAQGSIQPPFP